MATTSQRRGLQGVAPLRRKLRNMHKLTENSLKPVIEEAAEAIKLDAIDGECSGSVLMSDPT